MAKIIKATDCGFRKVIKVALNPDDPEWVHVVGEQVRDSNGVGVLAADNSTPVLISSATVPAGETGQTCHNCRYNWDIREFVFNGRDLDKTDDELLAEVATQLVPPPAPVALDALVGQSV